MDISHKTTAFLIDELITTCMKCWFAQEDVMSGKTDKDVANAAKRAQQLNNRRNKLMRAIDERLDEADISVTDKTYDKK